MVTGHLEDERLLQCDEVLFVMTAQPHGVHVQISHHDRLRAAEPLLRLEPGNNLSRQKVSADRDIRILFLQHLYKRTRVELVKSQPEPLVPPRFVEPIVQPPEHVGSLVDHFDIGLGIKIVKHLIRIFQGVDMTHVTRRLLLIKRLLDGLGSARVAASGRNG